MTWKVTMNQTQNPTKDGTQTVFDTQIIEINNMNKYKFYIKYTRNAYII